MGPLLALLLAGLASHIEWHVRNVRDQVAEPNVEYSENSELFRFSDMLPPPPRPRYTFPLTLQGQNE